MAFTVTAHVSPSITYSHHGDSHYGKHLRQPGCLLGHLTRQQRFTTCCCTEAFKRIHIHQVIAAGKLEALEVLLANHVKIIEQEVLPTKDFKFFSTPNFSLLSWQRGDSRLESDLSGWF